MDHLFEERYRSVWNVTCQKPVLDAQDVEGSRMFFERREGGALALENGVPVPRRFSVCGIVANLPFPVPLRQRFEDLWREIIGTLGNPLSYGVRPEHRHLEIFLLQGPGESFADGELERGNARSYAALKGTKPFRVLFRYPFLTPDGTVVVKGYDDPAGSLDELRATLARTAVPRSARQSQWAHASLGRILEPVPADRLKPLIRTMESRWREAIGEAEVVELCWTFETRWYMLEKRIFRTLKLG